MLFELALLSLLTCCYATPPPGYVKPPETDKNPPKYEYGYNIADNKGAGQGKSESREGIFSLGRYYVELRGGGPKGASQNVEYITDEWGYHPLVTYSSVGDHSQTSAQFALGEKAVEALRKNNQNQQSGTEKSPQNSFNRVQLSSPAPSASVSPNVLPTQAVPIRVHPSQIPSTLQIIQTSPNIQPKQPRILNHIPENLPLFQNTIPYQYYYPQLNMPQAQFLIQPNLQQNMPAQQFLIQDQNIHQNHQYLLPIYQNVQHGNSKLINNVESFVNINSPSPTQVYTQNVAQNLDQNLAHNTQNVEKHAESYVQINIPTPTQVYTQSTAQNVEQNAQSVEQNNQENAAQSFVQNNQAQNLDQSAQIVEQIKKQTGAQTFIQNSAQNVEQNSQNKQQNEAQSLIQNSAQSVEQNSQNTQNGAQLFIENAAYTQNDAQTYAQNIAKVVSQQTGAHFLEQTSAQINDEQHKQQLQSETVLAQNEAEQNAQITAQISAAQTKYFENSLAQSTQAAQKQQIHSENVENERLGELFKNIEITKEQSNDHQKIFEEPNKEIQNERHNYHNQQNNAVNNVQTIYIHEQNNQKDNLNNLAANKQIENQGYYVLNQDSNSNQQFTTETDYNKGQYLIEVTQHAQKLIPNVVPLPQNTHQPQNHQNFVSTKYTVQDNHKNNDFIIHASPHRENNAALFKNTVSQVKYSTGERQNSYDESVLELEHPGGYGSRISSKPLNQVKLQDYNTQLIDRTKNLVTGVDVLNINDAITNAAQVSSEEISKETKNSGEYIAGTFEYNLPNTILQAINNENVLRNSETSERGQYKFESHQEQVENERYNSENVVTSSSVSQHQETESLSTAASYSSNALNSRNKLLEILNSERIIPLNSEGNHISFADKPIVVADLESYQDNSVQSTTVSYKDISEGVYSTTQNTIETKITSDNYASTETPILITPRPVSNTFLAPITAAVSLQASGHNLEETKNEDASKGPYVDIQQSIPYYLGKIEFVEQQSHEEQSSEEALSTKLFLQNVNESQKNSQFLNLESGEQQIQELNTQINNVGPVVQEHELQVQEHSSNYQQPNHKYPQAEPLIQGTQDELLDQVSEQGQEISTSLDIRQHLSQDINSEEASDTKFVQPYGSYEQPELTRIVEKHVPFVVEKKVENTVRVPVEVTKYINNPYPVHIPYPQPVAVPVEVERLVQTIVKEPYPVEVPVEVKVPHPVHITKYIEKPYPVEKIIERPITIEKIIEKPVTKYIDKPYPVHIPHPVAIPVQITVPQPYPVEVTKYVNKPYGIPQPYPVHKTIKVPYVQHVPVAYPVTKLVQVPVEVPKYIDRVVERPYPVYFNLQHKVAQNPYSYAPKYQVDWKNLQNCEFGHQSENMKQGRLGKLADYIGLVPPLKPTQTLHNLDKNFKRRARNSFEANLRIEYGFKPPIIPSIQTDEYGMPLKEE